MRPNKEKVDGQVTIGTKLSIGFGLIIFVIIANIIFTISSTFNVNGDFKEAMAAENQTKFIAEKEIDHLMWVKQLLQSIIAHEQFTGQLDHTQCGFGKWYYSEDTSLMTEEESQQQKNLWKLSARLQNLQKLF